MVLFNQTKKETELIQKICDRALKKDEVRVIVVERLDLEMDITAAHCNGCRLDLEKLLSFNDRNFFYDIIGITIHVDRKTGKLRNHFLPRCAV